ncbi:RNA methyltransferase [Candidatus Parcubacteria bacterium]|nr:RNA methyltransferase [Patescibacteria group bacterium]MBU4309908.1 RNA methyltransferase [Patescibacteria group bacterium]MBU4432538.1 RNA methyltransferase [Patescibacteria group bacterium]MBU4577833.1 RNA methyltransferase [Patescibacteria group bacterium]MCG2696894.1 RNA methyltransferase [Candidatus Parcubacteria bacterium]
MLTSKDNQKIKDIIKLRKSAKRKKDDLIIVEGRKEIGLALKSGLKPEQLFYSLEFEKEARFPDWNVASFTEVIEVSQDIFAKIAFRETPDGYLATFKPLRLGLSEVKLSVSPFVVILESIEKPGNLGAILRTCDAAGVDAVIVADQRTDIYNPNVIRSSLGTVFTEQIVSDTFENIIEWLELHKIKTFAATPDTKLLFTEADYNEPTAILIGTEHEGLSAKWLEMANYKIKIPMKGKMDSLNASVSAGVVIYEVVRQRGL